MNSIAERNLTQKNPNVSSRLLDCVQGSILGSAIGDAYGFSREGLSPDRCARMMMHHGLIHESIFNKSTFTTETEQLLLTNLGMCDAGGDLEQIGEAFARRLRRVLPGFMGGMGMATFKAWLKLNCGFSPMRSGVFSAGSAPGMRVVTLGVIFPHDLDRLRAAVSKLTRVTHTHPIAEQAAFLIACAAAYGYDKGTELGDPASVIAEIRKRLGSGADQTLLTILDALVTFAENRADVRSCLKAINMEKMGPTGFIAHTVPLSLYAWTMHPHDLHAGLVSVLALGNVTAALGTMTGGLIGATSGISSIPHNLLKGIHIRPLSPNWVKDLAEEMIGMQGSRVRYSWKKRFVRAVHFYLLLFGIIGKRILPPY
ncbi:MAG: ADP-ribosylglycohydrolase family protein [Magnetococcus sp. DMHC-1]